ncbi:MAG: sugar ABC transporter ATP-binding protein [Spirochaetaceae bacterium]
MEPVLELRGVSKAYPGVQALDKVDCALGAGEVLGLVGENGAGKSTLIKIVGGIVPPDTGMLLLDGRHTTIENPRTAEHLGIGIIHQELNLIPNLSVADNVFICAEPTTFGVVDKKRMNREARVVLEQVGLDLPPDRLVETLSVSQMQLVEIARALSREARILIMDEPTSSLTEAEAERLFSIVRRLKSEGVSILYVSHKMEEIFALCDRIQVLRDGKSIGSVPPTVGADQVIKMMVGREIEELFERTAHPIGNEVLSVEGLSTSTGVKDARFTLHEGEVLGFAGLVGAGRTEIVRALFGLDQVTAGKVLLYGKKTSIRHPEDAVHQGLALVPEDRKEQGLILSMSVSENVTLANLQTISRAAVIDRQREKRTASEYVESLNVRTPSLAQIVRNLSGGNQQKVVLGKWLSTKPRILILDEPTRGIDIGAKREIYHIINELAREGVAILLISSELIEILSLSDRIIVMHKGYVKGELDGRSATQEEIMKVALS